MTALDKLRDEIADSLAMEAGDPGSLTYRHTHKTALSLLKRFAEAVRAEERERARGGILSIPGGHRFEPIRMTSGFCSDHGNWPAQVVHADGCPKCHAEARFNAGERQDLGAGLSVTKANG